MRISKTKTILITILSLTLLFYIGCDNENKTGGRVSPTSPEADSGSITETEGGTSKPEEKITIKLIGETTQEPAIIFLPDISETEIYLTSVSQVTGSIYLAASHFEYNKDNGELKLSTSGLDAINTASQEYKKDEENKYEITFNNNRYKREISIIKKY